VISEADKTTTVLRALANEGPQTVDEFVTRRGWYVNSWAPTFTKLRKAGLAMRTGDQRSTTHGARAHVIAATDTGRSMIGATA
jgi:hypothetical protein